MSAEQPTVLPWHKETAQDIWENAQNGWVLQTEDIIARHDPHATTLRLLEEAAKLFDYHARNRTSGIMPQEVQRWLDRAHLAAHSKPSAVQQSAQQEGSQ